MIKWLVWTIWTLMSSVLKKADKLNLSLSLCQYQLPSAFNTCNIKKWYQMPIWFWWLSTTAKCKTAVTPLLMHWSYCSLALSHRFHVPSKQSSAESLNEWTDFLLPDALLMTFQDWLKTMLMKFSLLKKFKYDLMFSCAFHLKWFVFAWYSRK